MLTKLKNKKRHSNRATLRHKRSEGHFLKDFGVPFFICFTLVSVYFLATHDFSSKNKLPPDIAIILSPHFDDAVLSLGGLMAQRKVPTIVATFFSGKPSQTIEGGWDSLSGFKNSEEALAIRTGENANALKKTGAYALNLNYPDFQYRYDRTATSTKELLRSIQKDIETILNSVSTGEQISIYGPADFGPALTHPDHKLVHDAFLAIAKQNLHQKNLHFFFYEDFPYTKRYQSKGGATLKNFLEKSSCFFLVERLLPMSASELTQKIKSIGAYASQEKAFDELGSNIEALAKTFTEHRCQTYEPSWAGCEVVYEIENLNQSNF